LCSENQIFGTLHATLEVTWFEIQNIIYFLSGIFNLKNNLVYCSQYVIQINKLLMHVTVFFKTSHNYKRQAPV
jgi:hypothetical protein